MAQELKTKIAQQQAKIGIIGLGYVGLPLAAAFCEVGFPVWGFDNDAEKIAQLQNGKTYLKHLGAHLPETMLKQGFCPSNDMALAKELDVLVICVPTPLTQDNKPDLSAVLGVGAELAKHLQQGQMVVLESSTYPNTTSGELAEVLAKSGLEPHKDFHLVYSPEREDPGNAEYGTRKIPKLVGADTDDARALGVALYGAIVAEAIPVASTQLAEAAKLTENVFRSVNIALVNELKHIFDAMGIDVWEVIKAASSKPFGYMPFYPGPGLGGHCIPIDPFYLAHKAEEAGAPSAFIALAGKINTAQPDLVIAKLIANLADNKLQGKKLLLIGVAYKPDIDDTRESPALAMIAKLMEAGAEVDYHDSFVRVLPRTRKYPKLAGLRSVAIDEATLPNYDAVIICTAHTNVAYNSLATHARLVIDTRNAMAGITGQAKLVKA